MAIWLRRAALGWGRSGSKHLMHHATRDRMPEAVRGSRAHRERASAHRSGWHRFRTGFGHTVGPISRDRPPAISLAAAIESFAVEYRHLDNSESTGLPLDNSEFRSGLPYLATALRPSGALSALPHRAQSSVRVNATLHHPLVTSSVY